MPETYIERILRARVYDVARETPLTRADSLSRRLGKLERYSTRSAAGRRTLRDRRPFGGHTCFGYDPLQDAFRALAR